MSSRSKCHPLEETKFREISKWPVQKFTTGWWPLQAKLLTWQTTDGLLFVRGLLGEPEVVEPLDHLVLDVVGHPPHPHVRFHAVKFGCKANKKVQHAYFQVPEYHGQIWTRYLQFKGSVCHLWRVLVQFDCYSHLLCSFAIRQDLLEVWRSCS